MSSKQSTFKAGRIIIGLDAKGMESQPLVSAQPLFTPKDEKEYLERVKLKATARAKAIIATAMHEAEGIKEKTHKQGYDEGMAQASQILEQERQKLSCQLSDIAKTLNAEKHALWSSYRQDIMILLKTSLEKVLGAEMKKNRIAILENLLGEALSQIDARNCITITCAPDDKRFLDDLLTRSRTTFPDLSTWVIKACADMQPGGLKVESCNGMVDNSIAARYTMVQEILDQIDLEDSE